MRDDEIPDIRGKRIHIYGKFIGYTVTQLKEMATAAGAHATFNASRKDEFTVYGPHRDPDVQPSLFANSPRVMSLRQFLIALEKAKQQGA